MPQHDPHKIKRMGDIEPFRVMALLARARQLEAQGKDIVHMEIGEPDFPTPQPVIDAATKAIAQGDVHYTPATGLPVLREAIADYYQTQYGATVSPQRIIVTPGASGALLLSFGVLLEPGQTVLMADPGYPCNRNFVRFLSGHPKPIPVDASSNYQLTLKLIEENWTEDCAVVMLASPANPTGTLVPTQDLLAIAEFVQKNNAHLIIDEIYHGLVYEAKVDTALNMSDEVFVVNSFSKFFSMTGWRIGWLVAPEVFVDDIDKLAQNLFLAAPTPAQHAALAALSTENMAILNERREQFRQRRDYLLPALKKLGFSVPVTPQGAFYIYAGCERFTKDSEAFASDLLENAGVAITPGNDFGHHQASTHVRFAYTTSLPRLEEGVERLRRYLIN